ncbi:MAG: hypothetical protein UZ13_01520 [Chloroflexi bacterium OLB13]|nr:MAG: hypothetical protein UZ13_01520 [Chloroflexi bacterium OLB13]RIK40326.1 MAG: hypothetical protein DCC55_15470 [Chloroflexota bacterium]
MTQTLEVPTTTTAAPASDPQLIVMEGGKPRYALIEYELYLALQEAIEEWYAGQRAAAAYEEWLQDPSTARPWEEVKAEMIAEGLIDA